MDLKYVLRCENGHEVAASLTSFYLTGIKSPNSGPCPTCGSRKFTEEQAPLGDGDNG